MLNYLDTACGRAAQIDEALDMIERARAQARQRLYRGQPRLGRLVRYDEAVIQAGARG
jgi:hypothetical protein